jgi:hypothetical protein
MTGLNGMSGKMNTSDFFVQNKTSFNMKNVTLMTLLIIHLLLQNTLSNPWLINLSRDNKEENR